MTIKYSLEPTEENIVQVKIESGDHTGSVFKINNISFKDDAEEGEDNCLIDFDIVSSDTVKPDDEGPHVESFTSNVGEIVIDILESIAERMKEENLESGEASDNV